MAEADKFMPGSDADSAEIFTYPFLNEEESKEFIEHHGKIMFIIRGPPGTGKRSLTDLIKHHFPTGMRCSADDYFTNTFNSHVHSKESLKQSHFYCHKRVKQECVKKTHPVIVSNTHMKKRELQEYLNFAAEYEYTIIIVSTLDKFKVTPEILAKSNTKGLDVGYFRNRMKAWQDIFPILMGWFLCLDDSFCVLKQLQLAIDALLGDGKFCRVFDAFDTDTILKHYKAKTVLCCIAGFMKSDPLELSNYYKSAEIRGSYGKCFTISIKAFVVTKCHIFALVQLNSDLKKLMFNRNFEDISYTEGNDDMNDLINDLQSMSLKSSYNFKLVSLNNDISWKPKSAVLKEHSVADHLNIYDSSFIHLAQREEKALSASELNMLFRKTFANAIDQNGQLHSDQFSELEGGYVMSRLYDEGWIINLPKILSVKTVFTGLYS